MAGEWKRTSLREAGVTLIDCGQGLSIRRDSIKVRLMSAVPTEDLTHR